MAQVVTQLIVDASGAKQGVAEFEAAMAKAKTAAVDAGTATTTSFERAQSQWTKSLAATDPIIKAQIAMERDLAKQRQVNADAMKLGIATQDAAAAQLDNVRQKHEGLIQTLKEQNGQITTGQAAWVGMRNALSGVSGQLIALSAGAGPVGVFLSALGPWGVAAAVGVGAVTSAFNAMVDGANHIGDKSVELKKFSDVTGLTVGQIKSLNYAGSQLGVGSDQITTAVERFSVGLDEAHKATGTLFDKVREINPALALQLAETKTTAQGWDVLAQAIKSATSESQRNALTRAAFGRGGLEVGQVAISSANAGGIDAQADKISKATGLTSQWVSETARLRNENIQLEKSITTMTESAYALPMLQRQNEFLRVQKEIAEYIIKSSRTGGINYGPTGEPEPSSTPDIRPTATSVSGGAEASAREMEKLKELTNARANALAATIKQNNLDKERIGILGGIIGQEEALALRMRELKAAQLEGKITVPDFEKATADVERMRAAAAATTAEVRALQEAYGGVTRATAIALGNNEQQLVVAQAIGGAQRMVAQEVATETQLRLQNVPAAEATRLAVQQTQIAQANLNSSAKEQLLTLQDEAAVAGAYSEEEKISAQYVADRNKLIRDGVNPALAEQVAQQKASNAQAAEAVRQSKEYEQSLDRAAQASERNVLAVEKTAIAAYNAANEWDRIERAVTRANEYVPFLAQKLLSGNSFDFQQGKNYWDTGNGPSQFNPAGYPIIPPEWAKLQAAAEAMYGKGNFTNTGNWGNTPGIPMYVPNQEGIVNQISERLRGGKSIADEIGDVLKGRFGVQNLLAPGGITADQVSLIDRLTQLLPEDQQASVIEKTLAEVNKQPVSLAREELIKRLTDSLDQLKESTDALNNTIGLSDIYTTDPRLSHIGYRAGSSLDYDPFAQPTATRAPGAASGPTVTGTEPYLGPLSTGYAGTGYAGGGSFMVPGGYSANDNMLARFPVASGERVTVQTPEQQKTSAPNITINVPIVVHGGGDENKVRMSAFQGVQRAANQFAALRR